MSRILELMDAIEAYVARHERLPAILWLELRQWVEKEEAADD